MKLKAYKTYLAIALLTICCATTALAQDIPNPPSLASLDIKLLKADIDFNDEQPGENGDNPSVSEKTKTLSKTYAVDANDKLAINNQYGKVEINTWTKNEVKVDVEIKAFESTDAKAQELLSAVSVHESKVSNLISFRTEIERSNMNWSSRFRNGKEDRRGVQINYTIYMPINNPLDITNKYGSTLLSDFTGPVNIDNSYGSFNAMKLSNPVNRVKIGYGSADINGLYSGLLDIAYGSLDLQLGDKIDADIRYSSSKIDKLINGGTFDIKYTSGFKISEVDKSVKKLTVNASYSDVALGIDNAANFDFDVSVNYAEFHYNKDLVTITSKSPDDNERGFNPKKMYKGHFGNNSDATVSVKSNYGSVRFK
jgi:hypothetical protein